MKTKRIVAAIDFGNISASQDVPNAENRHIRLVGQPVMLSRTPSKTAARPPDFGEHTDEVLAEFGFSAQEIEGQNPVHHRPAAANGALV